MLFLRFTMKIKILFAAFVFILSLPGKAQVPSREDSLKGFDMEEMNHHLQHFKGSSTERNAHIERSKRAFIDRKYKLGVYNIAKLVKQANEAYKTANPNGV